MLTARTGLRSFRRVPSTSGSDLVQRPQGLPVADVLAVGGDAEVGAAEGVVQSAAAPVAPFEEADDQGSEGDDHADDQRRAGVDDSGRG